MLKISLENKEELGKKNYFVTSSRAFLHRYADSGFKTKWTGFWVPPIKILDYYAYRIKFDNQEVWLSWDNCFRFVLSNTNAIHSFRVSDFDVNEVIFMPRNNNAFVSVIKLKNISKTEKKVSIILETAVNMRMKEENVHLREYETTLNEVRNSISVKTATRPWFLIFGVGRMEENTINFVKKGVYKIHYPGSEQRCFLPGDYEISFNIGPNEEIEVPFIFSGSSKSLDDALNGFDILFDNWKEIFLENSREIRKHLSSFELKTPENDINETFKWGAFWLKSLIHDSHFGTGLFAGLPWFTEFWARDSFISSIGLMNIGDFETVKKIIQVFIEHGVPGKIDLNESVQTNSVDTYPLFLIALDRYAKMSGDLKFFNACKPFVSNLLKSLNISGDLVVDSGFTWMDTLKRNMGIEVESLWAEAMRNYDQKISERMINKISNMYWNESENYFFDSFNEIHMETINPISLLIFDQTDGKKAEIVLDRIEKEFSTPFGVRTISKKNKEYSPSGYHTGAVWGLTTGAAACAMFKYDRIDLGIDYLRKMADMTKKYTIGCLPEVINSENGELLGCGLQAWSCAIFITAVDQFLFGIKPDLPNKKILLEPKFPNNWNFMERYGKMIGENKMNISFKRNELGYDIYITFEKSPNLECELCLPKNIKKIIVGENEFNSNVARFKLRKHNEVSCFLK